MAENISAADVNSEEQTMESNNQAAEASLQQTPKLPSDLPAKPKSIDAYKNVVGNPVTGSNPMTTANKADHFAFAKNQALDATQKSQTKTNDYSKMRPYTYSGDFDGANFDRYYNTSKFESLGFSPYRDNESLYNQKMTLGDEFVRAASQWPGLVKTGFMSGVRSWGTMFTDPLAPDIEGARDMQRYMAIGSSSKGGVGGFLTNTFLNSGYTVGIGADLLMEELGLAAITGFTAGIAGEVTVPGMAAKLGMAARRMAGFSEMAAKATQVGKRGENVLGLSRAAKAENEATKTIKKLNGVSDMRSFWNTTMGTITSKTLNVLNPLENTVDFIKTADYATDYAKVAGTFGAFAKDMIMTKAAVSEAQLEGGMVKIDTTKDLIQAYRDSHGGQDPTGEELQKIENLASQASAKTALWNLPAIMWSNKFMYETMLAPINKMVKSNSSKLVDDIIFDNKSFRAIGDGYFEKTKLAFKALAQPKTYGKYGFNYLKVNFAEGIQENLQEAISKGAAEQAMAIYKDPTRADYEGYMGHFMKGLGEQFSAQGAETFAGGFVMGMFAQPIMSAPAWSISKSLDLTVNRERARAAKEERDRLLKQDVDALNELYKNDVNFFAPDLQAAIAGNGLSNDLYSAAMKGDQIGARNAKEAATFHHVHTALRTGKYDIFINKLKEYKNFTPKDAKEAFEKYGIEDGNKALKYIDKVINRAEQIKTNYENVANEFPNPFRPNSYKSGTPLYQAHLTSYQAWEEAKKNLIFAKTSLETHSERVEQMAQAFSKFGVNVAKSDAQTFMSLLDPSKTVDEINTLRKEIATLDPKNPEQQPLIAEKKQTVKLLNEFYNALAANKFGLTDKAIARTEQRARTKFANFVQYLNKKNKAFVYNTSIEEAYNLIKDSMQLKDEMQGLTNSVNILSNPTGFLSMQKRLEEVYSKTVRQKADILQFNKRQFITRKEANTALNQLQELHGLGVTPEFAQSLRESLASDTPMPLPTSFIDLQTDLPVDETDARFKKALDLWQSKIEFIQSKEEAEAAKEEGVKPETKAPETKAPEKKTATFDRENYASYPEDLKKLIQEDFDKRKASGTPILEDTVEDYALNNIFVQGIINKYLNKKKDIEEGKDIDNEYTKLSEEELKARIQEIDDKEEPTEEDLDILDKLEEALAYKATLGKLTDAQKATLKKIEFLSSKTRKKNDDQSGYDINGVTYNLRVTKLVDRILEKDFGLKQFSFSEKTEGQFMIKTFEKLKENIALKSKNKKKYVDNIVNELFNEVGKVDKRTRERFNDRKIQKIKEGLEDDLTTENFIKLIEKYVYEESSIRGNTADTIVRSFFNNETVTKPEGMNQDAFDNLITILKDIDAGIKERNEIIISKSLILSGDYNVEGKDEKVAGEMDLLVIDKEGNFKIYDLKTADNWNNFGTELDNTGKGYRKKYRYTLQLSLYKKLLEDSTGIKVKELELIPIETKEDKNGNITDLKSAFDTKNKSIEYNPIVEKYLQPIGTKTEEPVKTEKKEVKEPKTKAKIEPKDFIGKTYEYTEDGEKAIVKVLNITPGNEVLFETTFAETGDSFEQTIPFKEFQGSVSSGIFKEIKPTEKPTTTPTDIESGKPAISPYGVIAADYLFTGGVGVILSTDYFIQALSYAFLKAGSQIEQIRQKYINQGIDLGNLKDAIGTENYSNIIAEIRNAIDSTYKNQEVSDIFNVVLNNATGFPSRLGNEISLKLEKLNRELDALEGKPTETTPTDIEAQKADIEKRRQEEYNTQYNALVAGQVLDNDGEPVYEEDKGISANRLSTLTDKKYGHGHIRTSGLNSLEVLEKLLDGSDFSGMFGEIGSGAYSTWESGKFIIVSNNINPTTNNKLNLNEIEIILNAGLSPFAQELANKYPNVIFKDFNGKKYDAELAALKGKPTEIVKDNVSETKDAIYNTPIQPSKASGNKVLYIPRKIVELAYANDKDNNPDLGGTGQDLSNIIRRRGYAIEELNNILPGWRTMSLEETPSPTTLPVDEFNALSVKDKFNTVINNIGDKTIEGVLEPVTLPPGKVRPGKDWGYQLRLKDGKTLRIGYATRIQGVENIPEGETFTINKEKYTYEKDGEVITEDILAVKKDGKLVSSVVKEFDIFAPKTKTEKTEKTEKEEVITLEQLNKDINIESLKIAKERNYEVEYNSLDKPDISGNYIISKITKNSVTLTNPALGDVKVSTDSISSTIKAIVEAGKKSFSQDDIDKLNENKTVINTSEVSFNDKLKEDESSNNLLDNIC